MPKSMSRGSRAVTASSIARAAGKHEPILYGLGRAVEPQKPEPGLQDALVLAVDPGLQGTGVALFRRGELHETEVLSVPSKFSRWDWPIRADYLANELVAFSGFSERLTDDAIVVCEYPGFQGGAARTMGWQTGDLQKLTYLVGLFSGRFHWCRFWPVPVPRWKGQLPKAVTNERIKDRLGDELKGHHVESHAWDAIGIGLWAMGRF